MRNKFGQLKIGDTIRFSKSREFIIGNVMSLVSDPLVEQDVFTVVDIIDDEFVVQPVSARREEEIEIVHENKYLPKDYKRRLKSLTSKKHKGHRYA